MLISIADKANSVVQFITVLLIFAVVLIATLFVTRWLGNYQKQQSMGNNIEVLESTRISPNSFASIIRIGTKYVAVAVSKDNVTLLCELQPDDLADTKDTSANFADFGSIFNKVKAGMLDKKDSVDENDYKDE